MSAHRAMIAAFLTAVVAACGDSGPLTSPAAALVYIDPYFTEALNGEIAQVGANGGLGHPDWTFDGLTEVNGPNGSGAPAGATIVLHVRSPLYQSLDTSFVLPDTVTPYPSTGVRFFAPVIPLHRLAPAILGGQWSADLTGPAIQLEIYAPHGYAGIRITNAYVYLQACWHNEVCEPRITGSASLAGGPWQPDSTGRVNLAGLWAGWPDALPPDGYGSYPGGPRIWQAGLGFDIADDLGHRGHGGCSASIPSAPSELTNCTVIFQQ